jgi:hypothetical protein
LRSNISVTPGFKMLGEFVQIALLNGGQVQDGVKTVLVESQLRVIVESDAVESSTEGNGVSDGSHLERKERKKS